jgi:hypothetical protein
MHRPSCQLRNVILLSISFFEILLFVLPSANQQLQSSFRYSQKYTRTFLLPFTFSVIFLITVTVTDLQTNTTDKIQISQLSCVKIMHWI